MERLERTRSWKNGCLPIGLRQQQQYTINAIEPKNNTMPAITPNTRAPLKHNNMIRYTLSWH